MSRPKPFTVVGIIFLALGAFSFLSVAQGWYLEEEVLWRSGLLGLLDILIAYGILAQQWWVEYAFVLNAAGQATAVVLRAMHDGFSGLLLFGAAGALVACALAWYFHRNRNALSHDRVSYIIGTLFLVLWASNFWIALSLIVPTL